MTIHKLKNISCALAADTIRSDSLKFSLLHQSVLFAETHDLDAWQSKTCETCRFRVDHLCRHNPEALPVMPPVTNEYNLACAQYREEGEE